MLQHAEQPVDRTNRQNPHLVIKNDVADPVSSLHSKSIPNNFGQSCLAFCW